MVGRRLAAGPGVACPKSWCDLPASRFEDIGGVLNRVRPVRTTRIELTEDADRSLPTVVAVRGVCRWRTTATGFVSSSRTATRSRWSTRSSRTTRAASPRASTSSSSRGWLAGPKTTSGGVRGPGAYVRGGDGRRGEFEHGTGQPLMATTPMAAGCPSSLYLPANSPTPASPNRQGYADRILLPILAAPGN